MLIKNLLEMLAQRVRQMPNGPEREVWLLQVELNYKLWGMASVKNLVQGMEPNKAALHDVFGTHNRRPEEDE